MCDVLDVCHVSCVLCDVLCVCCVMRAVRDDVCVLAWLRSVQCRRVTTSTSIQPNAPHLVPSNGISKMTAMGVYSTENCLALNFVCSSPVGGVLFRVSSLLL